MAILGNIRKTGNTFVVVVIAFFVVMFLGSELPRLLPYFFSSKGQIGRLSGKQISQVDYRKFCEAIHRNFVSQGKQPTEGDQQRIKDQAFRYLIEHALYSQEIEAAGIAVGPQELVDLVQGDHIDAALMEFFKNPETAAFDKRKLLAYLSNLSKTSKEEQAAWCGFEKDLALKRAKEKLHQLMVQSAFHTAIEGDHTAKHAHTFCKVDYLFIPFSSVKNDLVPLNSQQLLDYMAAHKYHYTALSASRTIKYMAFPIEPNEKDRADFQKELDVLLAEFSTVSDPYAFAKQHTDGSAADTKLVSTADTLPNPFKTIKHTLKEGMVIGPVADDPFHTLYKLVKVTGGNYEIACIEKKPMVSDHTRNKQLSHLQHLTRQIKTVADLEQLAATEELTVQKDTLAPSDGSIGGYAAARKVVRWLYNEATLGKVSPLFDLGNVYLLAVMVDQVQAGDLVPLDSVRRAVYQKVLRQEKAKVILDKLKQVQANTLQGIAEQYGEGITIQSVDQLRYLENKDPELKQAQAFIGKCFGVKTNVISDPIVDENGVFIASVKNRDADKTGKEETQQPDNDRMSQIEGWMQRYYIPTAMEELAKVVDERYKIE